MTAPTADALIDRVDDADRPIGTVERGRTIGIGANFRTAHVFVFDPVGSLPLQRLAPTRERHPGRWGSSVAAYLWRGETYAQAAERRLEEELGLRVPLRSVAKIRMRDERSTKFVMLFKAFSTQATIAEPDHIAELKSWSADVLAQTVADRPFEFTPTFLELYRFYRRAPGARDRRS